MTLQVYKIADQGWKAGKRLVFGGEVVYNIRNRTETLIPIAFSGSLMRFAGSS